MIGLMKKYWVPASISLVTSVLLIVSWLLVKDAHFDILQPKGTVAEQQRDLLYFALILCAIVVIPVFAMLAFFAWKFRESNKKAKYKPEWDNSLILELIWWGVPIIIIAILATATWFTSHSLDPYRPIKSDNKTIEVQVVALQWRWLFIYPELGVATINQLPIPVDTPISFSLSADAPMSAFWVPTLGSQIYTMNGMNSRLHLMSSQKGVFDGYSTNINGKGYSGMKFRVKSTERKTFDEWVKNASMSPSVLDMAVYEELAKPSHETKEQVFRLADRDLYQSIINKYMNHGLKSDASHQVEMEHM